MSWQVSAWAAVCDKGEIIPQAYQNSPLNNCFGAINN